MIVVKNKQNEYLLLFTPILYSMGSVLGGISFAGFLISALCATLFFCNLFTMEGLKHNKIIRFIVIFIITYTLISFVFTFGFSYEDIRRIFINPYFILPYLSIIIATKRFRINIIPLIIKVIIISDIIFLIYAYMNFNTFVMQDSIEASGLIRDEEGILSLDSLAKRFGMANGFLLFLLPYLKNKYKIITTVTIVSTLFLSIFLARRNLIFTNGLYLIFAVYSILSYLNISKSSKLLVKVLVLILGIYISTYFINLFLDGNLGDGIFSLLSNKIDSDTRGDVTNSFMEGMTFFNWIFGKGVFSTYYDNFYGYREVIETGWQHICMKIGIIGLFSFLIVFLITLLKNFSRRNILINACVMYIVVSICEMVPAGVPAFDFKFILLWILISICSDPKFRSLSNQDIIKLLRL